MKNNFLFILLAGGAVLLFSSLATAEEKEVWNINNCRGIVSIFSRTTTKESPSPLPSPQKIGVQTVQEERQRQVVVADTTTDFLWWVVAGVGILLFVFWDEVREIVKPASSQKSRDRGRDVAPCRTGNGGPRRKRRTPTKTE